MFGLDRKKSYLALILHAHLPFVRHPEKKQGVLEEFWFFEAMNETYLPLVRVLERLLEKRVIFRLTLVLSPTLTAMFKDPLLIRRFLEYMEASLELCAKERIRNRGDERVYRLSCMYQEQFNQALETFHSYNKDLTSAFSSFQEDGSLELITCAATHAYLPLIHTKEAMKAQVQMGVEQHQEIYGRLPRGIWLPECGYTQEVSPILKEFGLEYFCLENHGILYGRPRPKYGAYAPVMTPDGVAAFGRDVESSKQVWSAKEGYPGDYQYREFYRDIGYELSKEYLGPFFFDGIRKQTGIKYHRITGNTEGKDIYNQEEGKRKAREHAHNFLFNRQHQLNFLSQKIGEIEPIVVAPYDAELFGHWWFEGPQFLEEFLMAVHEKQKDFSLITPGEYLDRTPKLQVLEPTSSSWGYKGYHEVWLEGSNDWIYRHLHEGEKRMKALVQEFERPTPLEERALNQSLKELLLAQSSDWAFIMKTRTMVEYAEKRVKEHLENFLQLEQGLKERRINENLLDDLEKKHTLFPDLDYRIFTRKGAVVHI